MFVSSFICFFSFPFFFFFFFIFWFFFSCFRVSVERESSYSFSCLTHFLLLFFSCSFTLSLQIVILALCPNVYFSSVSLSNFSNYIFSSYFLYFSFFFSYLMIQCRLYFTNWHVSFSLPSLFFYFTLINCSLSVFYSLCFASTSVTHYL